MFATVLHARSTVCQSVLVYLPSSSRRRGGVHMIARQHSRLAADATRSLTLSPLSAHSRRSRRCLNNVSATFRKRKFEHEVFFKLLSLCGNLRKKKKRKRNHQSLVQPLRSLGRYDVSTEAAGGLDNRASFK